MKSLSGYVYDIAASYTKSVIKAGLRSRRGRETVWVVVEGEDDINLYSRFLKPDSVKVLSSENEKGQKGCAIVEEVVSEIRNEEKFYRIFGVVDADYVKYESGNERRTCPDSVFRTDYRDLEMMLLSAPSVQTALKEWAPEILENLRNAEPILRRFGYARICNHVYSLGCNFSKRVRIGKLWNETTHKIHDDWERKFDAMFFGNCRKSFTPHEFEKIIADKSLDSESIFDVCQGHDTVKLMHLMMILNEFNEHNIMRKMIDSYAETDFMSTHLYASIISWSVDRGVPVLISTTASC